MPILVVGGAGFIGRRLIPILEKQGEQVVCMDINPDAASFGERVKMVRGDVTQFDEVMAVVSQVKPERLINLFLLYRQRSAAAVIATKLNVLGMDNVEAARLCGVKHTVYASSLAVSASRAISANARRPRTT